MYKCTIRFQWAIPEKIQTLGGRWGGGGGGGRETPREGSKGEHWPGGGPCQCPLFFTGSVRNVREMNFRVQYNAMSI